MLHKAGTALFLVFPSCSAKLLGVQLRFLGVTGGDPHLQMPVAADSVGQAVRKADKQQTSRVERVTWRRGSWDEQYAVGTLL